MYFFARLLLFSGLPHPGKVLDFFFFFCYPGKFLNLVYKSSKAEVESRTQGSRPSQGHKKISRPRTDALEAKDQGHRRKCSPKKKVFKFFFQAIPKKTSLKKFFSGEKGLKKTFFRRSPLEEDKKRSSQIFREVSGFFQQNFNG